MTPFATLTSRAAALAGLALGLLVVVPAQAQVYRCNENGQTTYSDHPCGTRAKPVPMIDNTPSAADQKAARERASAEAAEVHEMETVRRKTQAAEDAARQAQIAAAQAAEQARREQRQKVVAAQEGVRYCHRVYVGPAPYPTPYPMPMPVIGPPTPVAPAPATGFLHSPSNAPKPFVQAPPTPTPVIPRPPRPHLPHYRIVCEPGYVYDGPEDLLPIQ